MVMVEQSLSFHLLSSAKQEKYLIPTLVCQLGGVNILRTLDPEDEHQISLARIFQAANLTIIDGLLRFNMIANIDYHTQLGFAGPNLVEIWTTVTRTRTIVASLWTDPPSALADLLAPSIDHCFSLYDPTRFSLLHNWRLTTISPAAYSTTLLLASVFAVGNIEWLQDKSTWIRTGIPESRSGKESQDTFDVAMIEWSVDAAERFHGTQHDSAVVDRWLPVIGILQRLLHVEQAERSVSTDASSQNSSSIEVDLVAMCERIVRQTSMMMLQSQTQSPAPHARQNGKRRALSTQTTPIGISPETTDKACQTEESSSSVSTRFLLGSWSVIVIVLLIAIPIAYAYMSIYKKT